MTSRHRPHPAPAASPAETGLDAVGTNLDAVVVGSGPNGLAAAVTLARAGLRVEVLEAQDTVGGGARTLDLGLAEGIVHDICSAVHPMALASPFLREFDLRARGVELRVPEASYAQPLEDGPAAVAWRDLDRTAAGLGRDERAWRRLFSPLVDHVDQVLALGLGDKRSLPPELRRPGDLAFAAGFVARMLQQGTPAWTMPLTTEPARALFTGVASHAIGPLPATGTSAAAMLLAVLAHAEGWPLPVGGSQAIVDALAADLEAHGGTVRTGVRITRADELPPARAHLFDTTAEAAAGILGPRLSAHRRAALRRLGHGAAAAKVDFVVDAPIPWRDPCIAEAGTVHVGGTRAQMAEAEAQVVAGRFPARPVTLVSDPARFDPAREVRGLRPVWAYAHVPFDSPRDPTEAITAQIERFAPGFRDTVVASAAIPAAEMAAHNENWVGGDIATGTVSLLRMVARPTLSWDPYRLGEGAYLCSAATPPGPGVHGMNGWFAAQRVLAREFGIREAPSVAPDA
ncbi:phytoene desaturase family protein [Brevibacterium album]|uniref:phytoene desaturase family protein n=1 Tax=Brevibacterium album TaxID=417948 RepID=UPI00041C027A|nr:NAD(P)/FAD-dependent oxidoreductase [Brevibacterium album]